MSSDAHSSTMDSNNPNPNDLQAIWNTIREEVNTRNPKTNKKGKPKKAANQNSTPTLVFSVIGDSDSFVPRPWPITLFQTALIEAAKSGGETWILFRKKRDGVSSIIEEAYEHYEVMEFGRKTKDIGHPNRHIKLINTARNMPPSPKPPETDKKDEKLRMYEILIEEDKSQLVKWEKFVAKQEVSFFSPTMEINMPVPIAIIVCEGDFNTIAQIDEALHNRLPVIIMKGSGKAADLVVDFIQDDAVLLKEASTLFGFQYDQENFAELKGLLNKIKEKKDLIGVFDLENDDPLMLSNIVGEAVVSCWSTKNIPENALTDTQDKGEGKGKNSTGRMANGHIHSITTQSLTRKLLLKNSTVSPDDDTLNETLNQSLQGFKRETRPYVLNPKYSTPTSLPLYFYFVYQLLQETNRLKELGPILLLEALKANRCDYVRVLLAKGVEFNILNLPELYGQTVSCQDCKEDKACLHMQWILNQIQESQTKKLLKKYKKMTKKKEEAGEKWEEDMDKTKKLSKNVKEAAENLCCKLLRYDRYKEKKKNKDGEKREESTMPAVLLWTLFANRKELAEICWLKSDNHLLTGLLCSAILKKLSKKAGNVKEQILSNDLMSHSKLFEQRCIALMDSMYNENTKHAINLMDDEAEVWGVKTSPLTFAYENFMYDVVAHTCSQKNMNKQWYKELPPDLLPFLKSACSEPRKFFTAPLTKYFFNYLLFFSMLIMYSAFVLTRISTRYYVQDLARVFEYYVYFWGAGDFIEELISCFGILEDRGRSHRNFYRRLKRYLVDFWNAVDLLSYILLIAALFVRHFYIDETFTIARRMFALSLLVMYLRFLEVFLMNRKLGPTVIMIKEMLKDLLGFLLIAVFVVLGVGIYYHANLWPDHQSIWYGNWTNWRIWTIIYYPYWQLYGEINLENLDGSQPSFEKDECTNNITEWESNTSLERCPQQDWTVEAVAALYMLFSNLLLVNLVIAMFSYTFERVQENSEKLWRFERYTVISDYCWRIPSPINLLFLPYRLICCPTKRDGCLNKFKRMRDKNDEKKKEKKKEEKMNFRMKFQKVIALRNHNKI